MKEDSLETLIEALRPFAALPIGHWASHPDEDPIWAVNGVRITVGDIRRARLALVKAKQNSIQEVGI